MTKSEAIEHLKNIAIYSVQDGYTDEARQALDMAIKALEEQPHWIPFAEMMPAFGESVLVQFDDDDMDILTFPNIYKRLKRVAWMPLPKPYGGESE